MDYSALVEYLRHKQYLSDLEKDILDTWNQLQQNPINMISAKNQAIQNSIKHPEIMPVIAALPSTVVKPNQDINELDVRYILNNQFVLLAGKEWDDKTNSN